MKFLILFAFVSAAIAFPRGSNPDLFESRGAVLEKCVYCIEVHDPQHQVLQFVIGSIYTNVMFSCKTEIEPANWKKAKCKKDAAKYCKAAVQVLGEFWFTLPNVNDCCGTEQVRNLVKSCT